MCTVIASIDPSSAHPVVIIAVRDEFADRAWVPPARHWPDEWPELVGGRDLLAGGTWLAVDPAAGRMACVVNGFGPAADPAIRLSRGELPLRAAAGEGLGGLEWARYDPFHLITAEAGEVRIRSWSGAEAGERTLPAGLHIVVNDGYEGRADNRTDSERASRMMAARIAHFRPRLEHAHRPEPAAGSTAAAWGDWLPLADGDGLDPTDPAALVQRRLTGEGRVWATTSVSLVALGREGVRYDFNPEPGDPDWYRVEG